MKTKIIEWDRKSDELVNELEDYAYSYKCKKCDELYCDHMLDARRKKFGKKIKENFMELIQLRQGNESLF